MSKLWPYHSAGRPDQPPLLFLHGFMGRGEDWTSIAASCTSRFYSLMPDLPGHGQNIDLPLTQPLDFADLAIVLQQFIAQLKLGPVNLVGYSMGGRLALYFAVKFPRHVKALLLEGASPGIVEETARHQRATLDDQRATQLLVGGGDVFVENWYEMDLFRSLKKQPTLLEAVKAQRKHNDPHWMAKIIRELSPGRQPSLWDKLEMLPMPITVVAGALDAQYAALAQRMAAKIPQARVEIVPETGHNVHLEKPEEFVELLRVFPT